MKRKDPTLKERLACFVLTMRVEEDGKLVPLIDPEHAKSMSVGEILSHVEFDHDKFVAWGGSNHPSNLTPRPVLEHRVKTSTVDIPKIAKAKRISAKEEAFRRRMLAKVGKAEAPPPERRKGRPMPGSKASPFKHRMNGEWVRR